MIAIRLTGVLCGAVLLSSCATLGVMNPPAVPSARIVGTENGPTQVLWTYESSLPAGAAARKAHMQRYEVARPLPVSLVASPGEYLWIIPVCNGSTLWDQAAAYQLQPGQMTARVSC